MALTPEQLAQQMRQSNYTDPSTGLSYTLLNNSGVGSEGYGSSSDVFGNGMYAVGNYKPDGQYNIFDANLQDTGRTGTYRKEDKFMDFIEAAMPVILSMGGAGIAAAVGAAAGGGAAAAGAGSAAGGSGAFLGEGALSGIPAWDGALSAAQVGGVSGSTAGTLFNAAKDSQAASEALGLTAADTVGTTAGAGFGTGVTGSPVAAGPGSSLFSGASDLLGSASGLLGPAATILGALAGSQGTNQSQSTTRDIPEWLKPYVLGENGLLNNAAKLTQSQMGWVPAAMQNQRNVAWGLLNGTTKFGRG